MDSILATLPEDEGKVCEATERLWFARTCWPLTCGPRARTILHQYEAQAEILAQLVTDNQKAGLSVALHVLHPPCRMRCVCLPPNYSLRSFSLGDLYVHKLMRMRRWLEELLPHLLMLDFIFSLIHLKLA